MFRFQLYVFYETDNSYIYSQTAQCPVHFHRKTLGTEKGKLHSHKETNYLITVLQRAEESILLWKQESDITFPILFLRIGY